MTFLRSMVSGKFSCRVLTWLQDIDDDALVVLCVDSFVDLGVLSTTNLLDDLIVIL